MTLVRQPTAPQMALRTAVILFAFVVIFTALLAGAYTWTRPALLASAAAEKMKLVSEVLPRDSYDNDLLHDTVELPPTPALGTDENTQVYRARRAGQPAGLVLEAVAPDGYSGKIRLVMAVLADGSISGVRVVAHRETPGLGDYIEPKKDKNKARPWITQFDRLALAALPDREWKVKKDGGRFDANAGATVTPRAVVKAVHKAMKFVAENRERLYQPAGEPRAGAGEQQ